MYQAQNLQKLELIDQSDPSSNIISSLIYEMERLKINLKLQKEKITEANLIEQEALVKSNQQFLIEKIEKITIERDLRTKASLHKKENTENRFL